MKKLFDKLFSTKSGTDEKKIPSKIGYVIILGLIGIMLIILSNIFSNTEEEANSDQISVEPPKEEMEVAKQSGTHETSQVSELEKNYKQELEEMLNKIQGVSEAEVMINLASTNKQVFEKNLIKGEQTTDESDRNGGTRKVEDVTEETQVVLVRQGDREVPLIVKTERPDVSGVFIVAKGADHAEVKSWIVEAVSRVLDVPTHRVSVLPKK